VIWDSAEEVRKIETLSTNIWDSAKAVGVRGNLYKYCIWDSLRR
jgi:hypothetical protein